MNAKQFLYENIKRENKQLFGVNDEKYLSAVCDAWMNDKENSKHRFDNIISIIGEERLKDLKVLDMASGCGSFVFYGLLNHYNVYGIEPEGWKHQFNLLKANEYSYPKKWIHRFVKAVGEKLPFGDHSFDVIATYQTLEHVQSLDYCFREFYRTLKKGGYIFVQCPDYSSYYEGHYRIPMFPTMNRKLFTLYLKAINRPVIGLNNINYTTPELIKSYLIRDYKIIDLTAIPLEKMIVKRLGNKCRSLLIICDRLIKLNNVFNRESSINLVAIKK